MVDTFPTMTQAAVVHTSLRDRDGGESLGRQIRERFQAAQPDALIVFSSSRNDHRALLQALAASCAPRLMIGCSSAGEFTSAASGEGLTCAVALRSSEMVFSAGLGRGITADHQTVAQQIVAGFRGLHRHEYRYRTALILIDALAGHTESLVEDLTRLTAGTYQFVGGGAGDDARFQQTHVFYGTEAYTDAAVALEILSHKPIGIGVRHGWQPASPAFRVTAADAMRLASLNAVPAAEVFEEHAESTGQSFDRADPLPFFLHNVLGIKTADGHKVRVPLGVDAAGCVACAAEIPVGATAHIMSTDVGAAADAAAGAARDALQQVQGRKPAVALFFDCVATRLRLGKEFGIELESLATELGTAQYAGFNTYGQIARAEGQFSGFHNCTAVVCIIPE